MQAQLLYPLHGTNKGIPYVVLACGAAFLLGANLK
jgi:hypothetical protein